MLTLSQYDFFFLSYPFWKVDNFVNLTIIPTGKKTIKKMKLNIIGFVNLCRNLPKNSQIFLGIFKVDGKNSDIAKVIIIAIYKLEEITSYIRSWYSKIINNMNVKINPNSLSWFIILN